MTGTPSKDRAEAHMAVARKLVAEISIPGYEPNERAVAEALAASFAEGMKRAAEIACSHTTANHVAISDAIFAEIGER